jgi:hypothetical protein
MTEASYEIACAKFAESERLDPRVGTLINLALCEEALGLVATARRYWEQATDLARATGDARVTYTTDRFDAIDGKVPRLTVRLAGAVPPGTIVRRDDVELGLASLGTALPVDPGKHTVFAIAAHRADGPVIMVELHEGESKDIAVEVGAAVPEAPEVRVTSAQPVAAPPAAGGTKASVRLAAIASGAAGAVGLGLGTYFGFQAVAHQTGSPGVCHGDVCDGEGAAVRRGAIQSADESTVAFVAGGALVAAGVVLWIVAPTRIPGRPSVEIAPSIVGHSVGARLVADF